MQDQSEIKKFIEDLRERENELLEIVERKQEEIQSIQEQRRAAEYTLSNIDNWYGSRSSIMESKALKKRFENMSIREMLISIAKDSPTRLLKISQARKILVSAGVFKDERNATTSMGPILSRNEDQFKRVERGVYRLIIEEDEGEDIIEGEEEADVKISLHEEDIESHPKNYEEDDDDEDGEEEDDEEEDDDDDDEDEEEDDDDEDDEEDDDDDDDDDEYREYLDSLKKRKTSKKAELEEIETLFASEDEIPF